MEIVTCSSPVNLAVIKYWGKRDEDLILPINSSLSVTLSQEQLCVTTTVAISSKFSTDRMWLNGCENPVKTSPRLQRILHLVREACKKCGKTELSNYKVHICSINNFPTAAGLASSAAGYSCLTFSLAKVFQLDCELSCIARQGSGSACRSMFGGFVAWCKGDRVDGTDSIAVQVAPESHWPEMRVLVLVVSEVKKETGSTSGMQRSMETSELLKLRAEHIVPQRMLKMEKAILEKDFVTFADITMKESNQLHAICMDTYPPVLPPYMNTVSHNIVHLITEYNKHYGTKVAYSFDAGPSAVLFLKKDDVPQCLGLIKTYFPPSGSGNNDRFVRGLIDTQCKNEKQTILNNLSLPVYPDGIKYIIHTKVGDGPRLLNDQTRCLLDNEGLPKNP